MSNQMWITKAAFFEALALGFLYPKPMLADAIITGEYAEAMDETTEILNLSGEETLSAIINLAVYKSQDPRQLLHQLRREYTRLFIGSPTPMVSPYAGIWFAKQQNTEPLLFVNPESMAVERFYRSCGMGQPQGTNEPLDHIGTELEFLQYLALVKAGALAPLEGITISSNAFEQFYNRHLLTWAPAFAEKTIKTTTSPFFSAVAKLLLAYTKQPELAVSNVSS
jgi:TorA maturation chaperone TorD